MPGPARWAAWPRRHCFQLTQVCQICGWGSKASPAEFRDQEVLQQCLHSLAHTDTFSWQGRGFRHVYHVHPCVTWAYGTEGMQPCRAYVSTLGQPVPAGVRRVLNVGCPVIMPAAAGVTLSVRICLS